MSWSLERKYADTCHEVELTWGVIASYDVPLLGMALFYSPLALAWDLILSSMLIEESRGIPFDHSTFDGFPSISHCGNVLLLMLNWCESENDVNCTCSIEVYRQFSMFHGSGSPNSSFVLG